MIRVGFVLLTHSDPEQVSALIHTLSELYDSPPIVCHHDFSQAALERRGLLPSVRFVEPHLPNSWGGFSIIPAALEAIRLLMRGPNPPDWFYLLSGSDYPTLAPESVLLTLGSANCDAFIDHREISYRRNASADGGVAATGFLRPSYNELAYKRYCAVAVPRPSMAKPFSLPPVGRSYMRSPVWRSIFPSPFRPDFRCYAGEHWFTANARAAEVLLADTECSRRLFRHLGTRESPEECYYHTLFGNSSLKLENNNLRYINWPTADAWHPRTLDVADLSAIMNARAHFARKVAYGSDLMNELNWRLGVKSHACL